MSWTHERARVAALTRSRDADDPELIGARRALAAERLKNYAADLVASWPPLSDEQIDCVAVLLRGGEGA